MGFKGHSHSSADLSLHVVTVTKLPAISSQNDELTNELLKTAAITMNTTTQKLDSSKDKLNKSVVKHSTPKQKKFVKKQFLLNAQVNGKSLLPATQLDQCSPDI